METIWSVGSYVLAGAISILLWVWRESGKKTKEEENVKNTLKALEKEIQSNKTYLEDRIRLTSTSCPIYADNTAADAGSQSGEIYRLTGDRTIYMKP